MDRVEKLQSQQAPSNGEAPECVVILDAGSQFGKVIDRRLRELKVEARLMPLDTKPEVLAADPSIRAIVISGGPTSVYAADAPAFHEDLFFKLSHIPILGICYGMQLLCKAFGGTVAATEAREDGQDVISCNTNACILFRGLASDQHVLLTHGDSVVDAGPGLDVVARSSAGVIAAVCRHDVPNHVGVQFHPEVDLSVNGSAMFRNFLEAAGCRFTYTMTDRQDKAILQIRHRLSEMGDDVRVLCLASGGVDSTVCAALLHKAIGAERVVCVHVDHGFMRLEESATVAKSLAAVGVHLHVVQATEDFLNATTMIDGKRTLKLRDSVHPEEKRKIIGDTFMTLMDRVTTDLGLRADKLLLAQGTLRPDLIESGSHLASNKAGTIKTHHNDTQLVRDLRAKGRIIEPLSDYHKDEVRELGKALGLPASLVMRQPFPGPGLGIRVLCADKAFVSDNDAAVAARGRAIITGAEATAFVPNALRARIAKVFEGSSAEVSVLPVRCVGVQGDARTYAQALAIGSAKTIADDGWDTIVRLATCLPKVLQSINRVVFSLGPEGASVPLNVRSVTPTTLSVPVCDKLRAADHIVTMALTKHKLLRTLSQVPVVMLPVVFEGPRADTATHSIVIRTFITNDFMTGVPATPGTRYMPIACLREIVAGLTTLPWISRVLYDLTAKPPGTTEWE